MIAKISFWQWPNLLALDAAIIAMAWQWTFARQSELSPGATIVLGLSVWLTYTADRLLDVAQRPSRDLLSKRHQFAKKHDSTLWTFWCLVLLANLLISFTSLAPGQLKNGFILLAGCLAYLFLSQVFSSRFFPKEILVATIFTAGTQIFLSAPIELLDTLAFALLCLANCLIIAYKESHIDARLRVRSITSILPSQTPFYLLLMATDCALAGAFALALLPTACLLALLQLRAKHIPPEPFRVLCDASVLIGPLTYLFFSSVCPG